MNYIAPLIVIAIILIFLYVGLRHPKYVDLLSWIFLITGTVFAFIAFIWAQGIPNGLILGLLCSPVIFLVGYMRFFVKRKIAKSLIQRLERYQNYPNDSPSDKK
jgi:hypothetical protein